MTSKMKIQLSIWTMSAALLAGTLAAAQAPTRFVGTITAINGNTISVKTDADGVRQVNVPATAALKRIAPGQKDLSTATAIQFSDLEVSDRALVKLDPNSPAGSDVALQIIAIKQADLAQKQEKEREDWQLRSVGGLVKSVDAASGVIVLSSGSGATAKTITVHTTKATILKRYAPASVRYDEAHPAPIDAIHAGDQLRARGEKNENGTEIAADEAISGSFRNISGVISALDATTSTLTLKDLTTKKPITIHLSPEAQMRRLPEHMAQMLATKLKGTPSGGAAAQHGAPNKPAPAGQPPTGPWGGNAGGGPPNGGDPQQMLSHAPAIQFADLKKGDAVMLVSTDGTTDVTAITLLAGVEALLEAPAASQNLLSNWSMNSGAGSAESAAQ